MCIEINTFIFQLFLKKSYFKKVPVSQREVGMIKPLDSTW